MAKAIKIKDVAKLINREIGGRSDKKTLSISYKAFEQILYKNEVCTDPRTVKLKWDILISKGILYKLGHEDYTAGMLDVLAFNDEWPDIAITVMLPDTAHTQHTHTAHTHINAGAGE